MRSTTTFRTRRRTISRSIEPSSLSRASREWISIRPGTGIGHQIMVEKGYATPGSFVVASDSHSNMYGALGAIGTPVVRTDAAAIWATGEFWWQIPRSIQVVLEGKLPPGSTGKDVIITLCGLYNHEEVLNAAIEFTGPGVATLTMDERLSIANMTTEWGALVGWFPVDERTVAYLEARQAELNGARTSSGFATKTWQCGRQILPRLIRMRCTRRALCSTSAQVTPHVSGPDTVQVMASLAEIEPKRVAIQKAYLVSCVNSRLEDLEAAARVLAGNKIAPTVKFYLAPASRAVQEQAEQRGVWQTLLDAGAVTLPAGCGPCIGLGTGLLEPGEVGISATNRNFKGRMGSREAQLLSGQPRRCRGVSDRRLHLRTKRAAATERRLANTKKSRHWRLRRRPWKSCPVFPAKCAGAWFSCRKTISTPTAFTARITRIATT